MVRSSLLVALMLSTAPAAALPANFKAQADAIIAKAVASGGPGVSVVVTESGKTAYRAERGFANVEGKVGIAPDTSFRFASITKQFTAAAILKLVDQGKVGLDDPLTKYLSDYPGPGGAATVRQLLNHTSGIMPYTQIPAWAAKAETGAGMTTQELIDAFKGVPLQFQPGEKYEYNNSGYVLLGAILEKVTGKSWDEAVIDLATGPAGLTSIKSGIYEAQVKAMALGYTDEGGKTVPAGKMHMSNPHAAGALIGTADDLARWGNALHNGKIVSPASYAAMTTAGKLNNGQAIQYGFGLSPGDVRGRKTIGHNGNINGFGTSSIYVADPKIFIVVLSNNDGAVEADALAARLAAAAVGDPFPEFTKVPVDDKAVESLLGTYAFADTERSFFRQDGKLYAQRKDRPPLEVFAAGGGKFFYGSDSLTWFEIREAAGKKQFAMYPNGAAKAELGTWKGPPAAPLAAVAVPAATLDSYAGSYTSLAGTFLFKRDGATLAVKLGSQPSFPMVPVSASEFAIPQVGATIRFNVKDGKAGTMTLLQGGQEIEGTRQN